VTATQLLMFQTEDLPLFSGTAPREVPEPLVAETEQQPLPPECEFCQATGIVGLCLFPVPAYCWREYGRA
jgi:hypothetical protein